MRFRHAKVFLPALLVLYVSNWIHTTATAGEQLEARSPSAAKPPSDEHGYDVGSPPTGAPAVKLVFDTGSDPEVECKNWPQALELARKMAGCDEAFACPDVNQKCQKKVRQCSPGCNICENLKAGGGASTSFGSIPQSRDSVFATTRPGFFFGYDSKFDVKKACVGSVFQLARVMVHEAVHACPLAGGSKASFDSYDPLRRCESRACCTDIVAPIDDKDERKRTRVCGDEDAR